MLFIAPKISSLEEIQDLPNDLIKELVPQIETRLLLIKAVENNKKPSFDILSIPVMVIFR